MDELETNSKFKNIRDLYMGMGDFKNFFLPWTNVVKDGMPQYFD